jgi:hypothetical protein
METYDFEYTKRGVLLCLSKPTQDSINTCNISCKTIQVTLENDTQDYFVVQAIVERTHQQIKGIVSDALDWPEDLIEVSNTASPLYIHFKLTWVHTDVTSCGFFGETQIAFEKAQQRRIESIAWAMEWFQSHHQKIIDELVKEAKAGKMYYSIPFSHENTTDFADKSFHLNDILHQNFGKAIGGYLDETNENGERITNVYITAVLCLTNIEK